MAKIHTKEGYDGEENPTEEDGWLNVRSDSQAWECSQMIGPNDVLGQDQRLE